jgi:hypothetical protein
MASHETAFRPLEPDLYPRYVNDDAQEGGYSAQNTAPAKIISLNAYKTLRNLQQAEDVKKIHDLEVLIPLINEARLRPVRFYRGLEEWLLEHHQDHA